jgi:ATP-dependent Lon protease
MTPEEKELFSLLNTKIDVGVLKEQTATLTQLCQKMDSVIEKLVEQHDRHIAKVYTDMEKRRLETENDLKELKIEHDSDVKEIHGRIDVVLDKVQSTELRLLEEIKEFRKELGEHTQKSQESFDRLNSWKWMVAGGILVVSWLFSRINLDTILHLAK